MARILLYSPDVIGHPRVYCRVIADALRGEECELVVAMGFSEQAELADSPDLQPLASREAVQLIDTRDHSAARRPHLTAEEIGALQKAMGVDTTLFIEADKSADEFRRIAAGDAPRLHGRNLGIFANTAEWYPGEDSFTGARKTLRAPTLRTTLGNVKRALFERRKSVRYFYEQTILGNGVLDEIITKDERLSEWHGPPVYWMPEISSPAASDDVRFGRGFEETRAAFESFRAQHAGREPLLYFGDAAFYKGYDLFLKFAAATPDTSVIHAGRTYDPQQRSWFVYDVEALREQLRAEGRLFETNEYVHSNRLKELVFGAIRVYVTTHRLALSSSTVIQAAELGKPVLVPDRGLLGYRVKANGIGAVYRYDDLDDLKRRATEMFRSDLTRFDEPLRRFVARFSHDEIRRFFVERLVRG
jgi:glycosyltransferase involved in cell wall biosynthesis